MIKLSVFINALHYVTSITQGVTQYLFEWEHRVCNAIKIFFYEVGHISPS